MRVHAPRESVAVVPRRRRSAQAVVNAGGTTFDHARLEALLGLTIGDVSVQVLSGKQAIVFP